MRPYPAASTLQSLINVLLDAKIDVADITKVHVELPSHAYLMGAKRVGRTNFAQCNRLVTWLQAFWLHTRVGPISLTMSIAMTSKSRTSLVNVCTCVVIQNFLMVG